MTELTNKDGIPIRVGQVWRDEAGDFDSHVVAFDLLVVVVRHAATVYEGHTSQSSMFHRLIEDPVWGDMSDWRIVSEDEKDEYPKPRCAKSLIGNRIVESVQDGLWSGNPYFVPRDYEFTADEPCTKTYYSLDEMPTEIRKQYEDYHLHKWAEQPEADKAKCKFCGTTVNVGQFAIFRMGNGEFCCPRCAAGYKQPKAVEPLDMDRCVKPIDWSTYQYADHTMDSLAMLNDLAYEVRNNSAKINELVERINKLEGERK